jgi:uncharacterized membrane protein YgaE (UPF0421/DUF939 family)
MMNAPRSSSRTVQAIRVAAAAITLIVAEWWHLPHTNLAVWTTHMVMSSHPHTTFQKGVERVAGRGAGILLGTLLVSLLGEQKLLALVALGEFVAPYLTQSKGNIRFVGLEMGMILPLMMVLPCEKIQTPSMTFYNIVALFAYTLIAVVVGRVWVALGLVPDRIAGSGVAVGARGG